MQVIQTINDTIRILFSPLDEDFRLLDFILVQEAGNKYLAQIIEIYDDKYDASQNVARIKLFFKINDKGEVFGYDHFTPSKECEIKKVKRDEIITFINEGKESLTIGLDYQNNESFDINLNFLKNNSVIFADKIEHSNNISMHLACALSRYNKHSVIFDFSGTLDIKNAKKLVLTKDVKLPLDFYTINYIWEKGLATASLETQAICREIFNEVQTYAKNIPEGFIPFNKFLNVVNAQYKATPITELTVLINKLKGYQQENIFASKKKDLEGIEKSVKENEVTILDFSELKTSWHKEFCEFAIRKIENAFVFARLNETNTDSDLINFIYDKNPNISFIPSISYNFSKMPHIIERANNYILLPTLNPRRDFGAANFELSSMSQDECILFGKDTENFIFTIKNNRFSDSQDDETRQQKTIKLNFNEDNTKETILKQKHKKQNSVENIEENQIQDQMPTEEELEFFEQLEFENVAEDEKIPVKKPEDSNVEQHYEEESIENQTLEEAEDDFAEESIEPDFIEQETLEQTSPIKEVQEEVFEEEVIEAPDAQEVDDFAEISEEQHIEEEAIAQEPIEAEFEEIETQDNENLELDIQDESKTEEVQPTVDEIPSNDNEEIIATEDAEVEENSPKEELTISKQEENIEQAAFQNILDETQEQEEPKESFSLEDIATQSVEAAFSEVMEGKSAKTKEDNVTEKLVVDENIVIDLEKIKENIDTKNENELPIFKNKTEKKQEFNFKIGETVEHEKYGTGEIVKVINYANRSLLQINFKEIGKRLLDPAITNIRKIEE